MIVFQILLIVLVALPVIAIAVYLWYLLAEDVRKRNREDYPSSKSGRRRRR